MKKDSKPNAFWFIFLKGIKVNKSKVKSKNRRYK